MKGGGKDCVGKVASSFNLSRWQPASNATGSCTSQLFVSTWSKYTGRKLFENIKAPPSLLFRI